MFGWTHWVLCFFNFLSWRSSSLIETYPMREKKASHWRRLRIEESWGGQMVVDDNSCFVPLFSGTYSSLLPARSKSFSLSQTSVIAACLCLSWSLPKRTSCFNELLPLHRPKGRDDFYGWCCCCCCCCSWEEWTISWEKHESCFFSFSFLPSIFTLLAFVLKILCIIALLQPVPINQAPSSFPPPLHPMCTSTVSKFLSLRVPRQSLTSGFTYFH